MFLRKTYLLLFLFLGAMMLRAEDYIIEPKKTNGTMFSQATDINVISGSTLPGSSLSSYWTLQVYYTEDGSDPYNNANAQKGDTLGPMLGTNLLSAMTSGAKVLTLNSASHLKVRCKLSITTFVTAKNYWSNLLDLHYYMDTAPTISPASHKHTSKVTVEMTLPDNVEEWGQDYVNIIYTIDGTDPTIQGGSAKTYIEPFELIETTTVKAAVKYINEKNKVFYSQVATATYTNETPPDAPVISPPDGTSVDVLLYGQNTATLVLSTTTANAVIYYTLDGSDPIDPSEGTNSAQQKYTSPVTLNTPGDTTIKAIATLTGRPASSISSSSIYLYHRLPPPTITLNDSAQTTSQGKLIYYLKDSTRSISMTIKNNAAYDAYVTIDGSLPTASNKFILIERGQSKVVPSYLPNLNILCARVPAQNNYVASKPSIIYLRTNSTASLNNLFPKTDLNDDGRINSADVNILRTLWGTEGNYGSINADTDNDGSIGQRDLDFLESLWWTEKDTFFARAAYTSFYLVIDVSAGPDAVSYPYEFISDNSHEWNDTVYKTDKIVLRLVPIRKKTPTFTMGSPETEVGRSVNKDGTSPEDQVNVTLTRPYFLGVFEITQQQWYNVMGTWPSFYNDKDTRAMRPVEAVSYTDIRGNSLGKKWPASCQVDSSSFLGRLRQKTGLTELELPTEAQWEYACRSMTDTPFSTLLGQLSTTNLIEMPDLVHYARYVINNLDSKRNAAPESGGTATVGSYQPNYFGFYDMHGNVAEWCLDGYGAYSTTAVTDPEGATSTYRVIRGGSCNSHASSCRSAYRSQSSQTYNVGTAIGFRLCYWLPL